MDPLRRSFIALVAVAAVATACDVAASTQEARTGLDASTEAQDVAAQSLLRDVLVTARTLYTESSSYQGAGPAGLASIDPSLCVVDSQTPAVSTGARCDGGNGPSSVSVFAEDQVFAAAARSAGGRCFWVKDEAGSDTHYGSGDPCTGTAAVGANEPGFPA